MRGRLVMLAAAAAATAAPEHVRAALACSASILLESLPYLAASTLLARFVGRFGHALTAYAGCGCGDGPAARSIPAAVATAALFGAPVALARLAAAAVLAKARPREHHHEATLLEEIDRLVPFALVGGAIAAWGPARWLGSQPGVIAFAAGAALGIVASPCALGGIAIAASLRVASPAAAAGILCTSGLFSVRPRLGPRCEASGFAYAALAVAAAIVAAEHGATLVHPRLTLPLYASSAVLLVLAIRSQRFTARRAAMPLVLLGIVVIGAPQPAYTVTETTFADGFAGERMEFSGVLDDRALVRYAITCCRADAAPVVLRLDGAAPHADGRWFHAGGTLVERGGRLVLHVQHIEPIAPPSDPFVYR